MRICLVSQEYPPETAWGGVGTQSWVKARALARLGHEVHVLTCSADGQPDLRTEIHDGVTVHRIHPPGYEFPIYGKPLWLLGYTWGVVTALHALMEQHRFDVLDFPEFGGEGFAAFRVEIEERDLHALCGQQAGGGLTEARSAAGNDGRDG
jgi:hypothetical protein